MANNYGAKWFDMDWKPQFDGGPWKETLTDYLELMTNYGPPAPRTTASRRTCRRGTRSALYENPGHAKVPFAAMTLNSINAADPTRPTVDPVPYVGVQFVAIPEFQGIGAAGGIVAVILANIVAIFLMRMIGKNPEN